MSNAYDDATPTERKHSESVDRLTGIIHGQDERLDRMQEAMTTQFNNAIESLAAKAQEAIERQLGDAIHRIEGHAAAQSEPREPPSPAAPSRQSGEVASQLPDDTIRMVARASLNCRQAMAFLESAMEHAGVQDKQVNIAPDNLIILFGKAAGVLQ